MVLSLAGELDLESAATLSAVLRDPENAGAGRIVLDLSGLEFIDSTGIGALVQARLQAGDGSRQLVLRHLPKSVIHLFDITGVTSHFTII